VTSEKLILPERLSETHCLIDNYFQQDGIRIKPFIEIGNEEAIKQFVRLDLGVGLLPRWIAAAEIEQGSLACVPLGRRRLRRRWGILHNVNRGLTLPESVFVNLCRNVATGLMQGGTGHEN
jgi:DNA-binding transcriptional LysR family regulator